MKVLQSALNDALRRHPVRLAVDVLESKFEMAGVKITSGQRRKLEQSLTRAEGDVITLRAGRPWQRGTVDLEITDEDIANLEERLDEWIAESLPRLVESLSSQTALDLLDTLRNRWDSQWRHEFRVGTKFSKRLEDRWQKPLSLLRMLVTITTEFGSLTSERLQEEDSPSELFGVQVRLHARGCQISREVIALLQGGFADGAMARWRTLHEIAVVSMLLSDGGDELAERYRLHEVIESRRAALEYEANTQRLGLQPLDRRELESLEKERANLIQRFGKSFGESYGWAAAHLGLSHPKFTDIERSAGADHLRPYYRMASYGVHANPKGVFFRLGILGEIDLMLAGASNYGLADPGQNTAISLGHLNSALAMSSINFDGLVVMKLSLQLSDLIGEAFVAVQHEMEREERAVRDE